MILIATAAIALSLFSGSAKQDRSASSTVGISSPSAAEANPSPYQIRDFAVGSFDRLKVSGPFKVGVVISSEPSRVRLQGPPALLADVVVAVEGGALVISFRDGANWSWNPGSGVNIAVFAPSLASVNVEGAADVEVYGVRGESFAATTVGAGIVKATLFDVGRVQLATKGSGGIAVDGSAHEATYVVGGAGSIDAMRLRVRDASIFVGGAGSSYANVSGTATISSRGAGSVEVVGGATCIKQPPKSQRIDCR